MTLLLRRVRWEQNKVQHTARIYHRVYCRSSNGTFPWDHIDDKDELDFRDDTGDSSMRNVGIDITGPLFTKRMDVLPHDLAESRSCAIHV